MGPQILVKDYEVRNVLICLIVCLFLISSSGTDDKSSDLLFHTHFISLDPNTYYISLTPCTNYRVKDEQPQQRSDQLDLNYTILLFKSKTKRQLQ